MANTARVKILDLGRGSDRLRFIAKDEPTFDIALEALAFQFRGKVEEVTYEYSLLEFAEALRAFQPPGQLVFGGNRGAELTLDVEPQQGGRTAAFAAEARLVRSGDDPWPCLSWLLSDLDAFWEPAARRLEQLLRP